MQTDLITKVYFNEHLTHSCVGMPQGLQALLSSLLLNYMEIYQNTFKMYTSDILVGHYPCIRRVVCVVSCPGINISTYIWVYTV